MTWRFSDHEDPRDPRAWPSNRGILAAGAEAIHAVWLWQVATRHLTRVLTAPGASALAFSPAGHLLASGGYDGKITPWGTASHPLDPPLTRPGGLPPRSLSPGCPHALPP